MIRFVVVEGVSRKRRNRHLAPFLDASTAVLASASASRRAAATAGIPVARSPTCAPAAANLASRSRSPDVDSCVSCRRPGSGNNSRGSPPRGRTSGCGRRGYPRSLPRVSRRWRWRERRWTRRGTARGDGFYVFSTLLRRRRIGSSSVVCFTRNIIFESPT